MHVAALIGASDPSEVIFTSGGTESVNWAIKATAERLRATHKHIVTSAVEHVVVLECCKYLEEVHGFQVTFVPVDEGGRVDPQAVAEAIRDDTCIVSIMHANNETGCVNDIAAIAKVAASRGGMHFLRPCTAAKQSAEWSWLTFLYTCACVRFVFSCKPCTPSTFSH